MTKPKLNQTTCQHSDTLTACRQKEAACDTFTHKSTVNTNLPTMCQRYLGSAFVQYTAAE